MYLFWVTSSVNQTLNSNTDLIRRDYAIKFNDTTLRLLRYVDSLIQMLTSIEICLSFPLKIRYLVLKRITASFGSDTQNGPNKKHLFQ